MTAVKYSLDELTEDLTSLVESQPEQAKLFDIGSSYLKRILDNPGAVPAEYRVPSGRGRRPNHGSYLLHQGGGGLSITAVVWGPGDHAAPHDHHT